MKDTREPCSERENAKKEFCERPEIMYHVFDVCKDKCLSTVTIVNDLESNMIGRLELVKKIAKKHKVIIFNNRGHYWMDFDKQKKKYVAREKESVSKQNKMEKPKHGFVPSYMPDPNCCKANGVDAYSLDMFVSDLERLHDQLGVKKTDLVGSSLGGLISQAYAAKHPDRVERLALMKTFTTISEPIKVALGDIPKVGEIFSKGLALFRDKTQTEKDYGDYMPKETLAEIGRLTRKIDMKPFQERIDQKKTSTMIIRCPDDVTWGSAVTSIKGAKEEVVLFCGHVFNMRNQEMYEKISSFLDGGRK